MVCCFLSRSVPESDHSFGNTSNGGVKGEKVPSSHQHLEEIDPKNDSNNSPSSLKVMAGKVPIGHNEGRTLSLPKLRHEYNIDSSTSENLEHKRENLSPENILDNIQENHQLHNTQSLPVWMPSVVATTVSEDAEEQTFDNIGKISLGQLKVEVNDIYGMGIFLANLRILHFFGPNYFVCRKGSREKAPIKSFQSFGGLPFMLWLMFQTMAKQVGVHN